MRVVAIATVVLAFTGTALAATPTQISNTIVATWKCQDQQQQPRSKALSPWKPHSQAFRQAQLNQWTAKRKACLEELHARAAVLRKLRAGLAGTPMSGTEEALEAAGRRYGVSPYFMAAAAGTESSFGAAACRNNHRNVWGLSSCGSGWYVPQWSSWEQAAEFYAKFLSSRWPTARTTYDYHGYAACSSCWGAKTASHMSSRFGVTNVVSYP